MNKDELLTYCRYYKGEKECPFTNQNDIMFWDYERIWCEQQRMRNPIVHDMVRDYNLAGLASYEPYDGTPLSLKALLFNRYCHWSSGSPYDCTEGFKLFYEKTYKNKEAE